MKATVKEEDGEFYLVFDEDCPFNVGDTLEWTIEEDKVFLRVVQPDLFSERPR
jgi:hypothetical protein